MKNYRLITFIAICFFSCFGQIIRADVPANQREELRMPHPLITDRQMQSEPLPQVAASTDSLVRVTTKLVHTYIDTIRVVRYSEDSVPRQDTAYIPADSSSRKGHYVQAYIGGGYGSIGFTLDPGHGGQVTGAASARAQLQYAWFFHPNWGIGAGVWMENISSVASLSNGMKYTDFTYLSRVDTDGEPGYNHTARVHAWREKETLYNVAIPISIQTQWWNEQGKAGIFGALGVAPTFAVMQNYRLVEGVVEHFGEYPKWGLTLNDMTDHEYAKNDDDPTLYTRQDKAKGKMNVTPMATVFAEVGALINLSRQIDLMIGLYGHYTPNNIVKETIISQYLPSDAGADAPPFGWADGQRVGPSTFMDEYNGLYATSLRGEHTNPWAVGLKVGIHWHHYDKPKMHISHNYDYVYRADTTVRTIERLETETIERIDTFKRAPKEEIKIIQKKVDKLNKIFFAFDSYTLNNKSKKYLRDIYAVLKEVPNHIIIGGHASEEGQAEYNEMLALNRATAVKNYLVQLGIPAEQLEVKNYGARVANEDNLSNDLSLDRRVEIIIME